MVNIIERTQAERDLEKKLKTLKDVTENILKQEKKGGITSITHSFGNDAFGITDGVETQIFVHLTSNKLSVKLKEYFDLGFKLAKAYEKETKENWTLKKDYG